MQIDGNGGVAPYDRRRLAFLNHGRTGEFVAWTQRMPVVNFAIDKSGVREIYT